MDFNSAQTGIIGVLAILSTIVAAVIAAMKILWNKLDKCEKDHEEARKNHEKCRADNESLKAQNRDQERRIKALEAKTP